MHLTNTVFDHFDLFIAKEDRFSQFKFNYPIRKVMIFRNLRKGLKKMRVPEMLAGQVYGNRNNLLSFLNPSFHSLADLLEHVDVKLANFTVAFKQRNKIRWKDHPLLGMHPAH